MRSSWLKNNKRFIAMLGLILGPACTSGTGSSGCSGCSGTPTPIPGGFPVAERFENAIQVHVSDNGMGFIEKNAPTLVGSLMPSGLNFNIPSSCSGGTYQVCCPVGTTCSAAISIANTTITPTEPNVVKASVDAGVKTTSIPFAALGFLNCVLTYDSALSGVPTIGLDIDISLDLDQADGKKLKVTRNNAAIRNFEPGDITITGTDLASNLICAGASALKNLFGSYLSGFLANTLNSQIDAQLAKLPTGREARSELSGMMASFSPRTSGLFDYFVWAGGYANAETGGLSLGVLGGFKAGQHSACVPVCQGTCTPPPKPTIAPSSVFKGNTRPDGQPFDVGLGVHQQTIDTAFFALYDAGGICLDLTSAKVSQINSGLFSVLIPSLGTLTWGDSVPMMLSTRPRTPPQLVLGKGLWHKNDDGTAVIDDPLLSFRAKDFGIEFYVYSDHRPLRIFTLVADIDVPLLLTGDQNGDLQVMIGALDKAFSNVRVENAELLSENDAKNLPQLFPSLIGLAGGFLGSGIAPIKVPSFSGLQLVLDGGSITTTDNASTLAVFAKLGTAPPTTGTGSGLWAGGWSPGGAGQGAMPAARASVKTIAELEGVELPPAEAFRLSPSFDPWHSPALRIRVGTELPRGREGSPVEYAYRIDGGFLHPWTSTRNGELIIRDPVLWLQGEHTVAIVSRLEGEPMTTDPNPVSVTALIKAPVSPESGTHSAAVTAAVPPDEAGGCSMNAGMPGAGGALLIAALALLALVRRRRR